MGRFEAVITVFFAQRTADTAARRVAATATQCVAPWRSGDPHARAPDAFARTAAHCRREPARPASAPYGSQAGSVRRPRPDARGGVGLGFADCEFDRKPGGMGKVKRLPAETYLQMFFGPPPGYGPQLEGAAPDVSSEA